MHRIPRRFRIATGLALLLAMASASADTLSAVNAVVRLQGANLAVGGSGTLIGAARSGSDYRMVFIGADHTYERVGPITTVGFGNLSAPSLNLTNFTSFNALLAPTINGQGPIDMALYQVDINLATLTSAQQSYLTGVLPVAVAVAPASSGTGFTGVGFGSDGVNSTGYGTQLSFSNVVAGYTAFSGSYTTDKNGVALNYNEWLANWTARSGPDYGACTGGCSGAALFTNAAPNTMIGYQVNGSLLSTSSNLGVAFTQAEVNWITANSSAFLAPVPEPGSAWLLVAGIGVLAIWRRRTARS